MATDPKIVAQLSSDLDNLNDIINDISKQITNNLNKNLAVTSTELGSLVEGFEKGKDITAKIASNIKTAQKENRLLGLNQNKLQSDLLDAQAQLNRTYNKRNQLTVKNLQTQIQDNKYQQELNDKVLDYLRTISNIADTEKKNTEEKKKQNGLVNILKSKMDGIAQVFTTAGLFAFFSKAILDANKQTTELGKSLGISYKAASGIRQEFAAYAASTNETFVNTNRLMKAQADLTEQLGIAVQYGGEELAQFSKLTEIVGLSADEAGRLTKASAGAGMELQDYVKNIRSSAFYAQQATKTHFSDKQILQDISRLSAGILVKFQGNPKAIAEAVVQAKKLGLNLEQVDKIGDSLLNWESSIENELKAELITGKKINLEKARAAALTGDQADLAKEIASQAGSLSEFQGMNIIAQKSLAEAFGLSRDEMADMLLKQEAISKYGSKAGELNAKQLDDFKKQNISLDEYLAKQDQQRSVQEKFNDAIEKLQGLFGDLVAGPFGTFLDGITSLLEDTTAISLIFGGIAGLLVGKMAVGLSQTITQLGIALGISTAKAAADTASAEALTFGAATIPILAGIGAVLGLIASAGSKGPKFAKGGIVTSEINNATIGEAGPEAIIPLNSSKAAGMLGGNMNIAPMVAAINEVRNAINALANKSGDVHLDGQKVGKSLGAVNALGTSQNQNSYRLA